MKHILYTLVWFTLFSVNYTHAENGPINTSIDIDDIGDEDIEDEENLDEEEVLYDDPYEHINRKIFAFNKGLNEVLDRISKPGSKPGLIRQGMSNFAQNFFEIPRFINYALQGNGNDAVKTVGRYVINTCLGFFGFIDVAEKIGLKKKRTTFDDTLKKWGVPAGPFVVLPFLGPTCMRGTVSYATHFALDTTALFPIENINPVVKKGIYWTAWLFDALNTRSAYCDFLCNITAMSKDEYKTIRNLVMALEWQ